MPQYPYPTRRPCRKLQDANCLTNGQARQPRTSKYSRGPGSLQAADDEEALRTAKADLWTAWWMRDVRWSSQPLGWC
jgi:hypothetical protein